VQRIRRLTNKPVKLYCHSGQQILMYYELFEEIKTEKEIIKRLFPFPEIAKRMWDIEMIGCEEIDEDMWFAIWGEGRHECYGSKGDSFYSENLERKEWLYFREEEIKSN